MSLKPESRFILRVHKILKARGTYFEKNHNMYRSGQPDVLYSGKKGCLWVEYKYLAKLPARDTTVIKPDLTAQQARWIANRSKEGRNVWVILGCPEGGVFLNHEQRTFGLSLAQYKNQLVPVKSIAEAIYAAVGEGCHDV
jgi:hypothetical protein